MKLAMIGLSLLVTGAAEAQMLTPGAAPYPSPPFLGGFVGGSTTVVMPQQCVIATPMAGNSVMLTPCPPGLMPVATPPIAATALPPQATQLPAPPPPPPVSSALPADRPIVIQILPPPPVAEPKEEPPAPAAKPAPKAAPKPAAKGAPKPCP